MKKIILMLGIGMFMLLLVGCSNNSNCCCCDGYSNNPNPYNVYVVCDNQDIWDMRGSIRDFDCECLGMFGCDSFSTKRICTVGLWIKNDEGKAEYVKETITCTEVVGKDRRCN